RSQSTQYYTHSLHDALPISDAELIAGYECPSLARLAEQAAQPAQRPAQALAAGPARPQAWPEIPRIDRYWSDLKDRMQAMTEAEDRKSTRLNSSHDQNSYAV